MVFEKEIKMLRKKIWYDEIGMHPIEIHKGIKYTEIINTPLVGHFFTIESLDMKTFLVVIRSESVTGWEVDADGLVHYINHWRRVGFTNLTLEKMMEKGRERITQAKNPN